jgi:hypothetical protein
VRTCCRCFSAVVSVAIASPSIAQAQPVANIPAANVRLVPMVGTAADGRVIRLSSDGTRAQLVILDTAPIVIDTRTGATLFDAQSLETADRPMRDAVMTPDGRAVVYGERPAGGVSGRTIRALDIDTGQDRMVGTTPTNVSLADALDDAAMVAYLTADASPPRVGVIGPQLPAREFTDPCPNSTSPAFVVPPVRLTIGGLLVVYSRVSPPPLGAPSNAQLTQYGVSVTSGGAGWCRGPHDRTVNADRLAWPGIAGLWATVPSGLPPTGPGTGSLVHLYTAVESPVVPTFYRTRPHGGSRNDDRFLPFTGAPTAGLSDGLYVLDRLTGVIAAVIPSGPGYGAFVLTSLPLLSDDGKALLYSAIALDAMGFPTSPETTFLASLDGDADGQFDAWELTYGLNPSSPADALLDADGDGLTNAAEFAAGTHPKGSRIRHFAEGAQGDFLATSLALFNPTDAPAMVNIRFLGPFSENVSYPVVLPANGAAHVDAGDVGLPFREFGIVVESDAEVVTERRMTWDRLAPYGSHSGNGVAAPGTTWYFAEGATIAGFQTFFLLQNPNAATATVTIEYLLADGTTEQRVRSIGPRSRQTVWVNQEGGPMAAAEFGTTIRSDLPIVSERAMYLNAPGELFTAGSVASGVAAPAASWFFAEGATGAFFDTFVLLANPGDTAASVDVEYLRAYDPADSSTALPISKRYEVAPHSRQTIWIRQEDPALADSQVGVSLHASVPIVAERTMWWPGPTSATWRESHAEVGATESGQRWAVADMQVDAAADGWDTFLLVATTEQALATIRVAVSCEDGSRTSRDIALSVNRTTLWMRYEFPQMVGRRCGATIESLPTRVTSSPSVPLQRTPIVVEKAMYLGTDFRAGGATLATRLPDPP